MLLNVKVTYLLKCYVGIINIKHVSIDLKVKADKHVEVYIGQANFARTVP